jgi:hypothetical protein
MREEPTWRIPVGILLLFLALILYALAVAAWIAPLIANWPGLAQAPVYVVLGIVWLFPLKRFLVWMETGRVTWDDEDKPRG